MPKRYEKIEFNNFANGRSSDVFIKEDSFGDSFQIAVDNKKARIQNAWTGIAKGTMDEDDIETHNGVTYRISGANVYTFNGSAFTLFQNIGAVTIYNIYSVDEKLYLFCSNGQWKLNDAGTDFALVAGTNVISLQSYSGPVKNEDGYTYFMEMVSGKAKLYKTNDDFLTKTLVYDTKSSFAGKSLANIQGFIYFNNGSKILRVTKKGTEIACEKNGFFSRFSKEFAIILSAERNYRLKIYLFNGFTITEIGEIRGGTYGEAGIFFDGVYAYIDFLEFNNAGTELMIAHILKIDKEGHVFKLWSHDYSGDGVVPFDFRMYDKYLIFSSANDSKWYLQNELFESSGYVDSGVINVGEHAPAHVLIRHAPLEANTSVKLYVKKDRTSSFGSSVVTNAVVGSTNTKYNFPKNYGKVDFMELQVQLLTSNSANTPHEVEFIYLYNPTGLESSL